MPRWIFGILSLVFCACLLAAPDAQAANPQELLRNPGFAATSGADIAPGWANNSWGDLDVTFSVRRNAGGSRQIIDCRRLTSGAVQFVQAGTSIERGRRYAISIRMKGAVGGPVQLLLRKRGSPYTVYASKSFAVGDDWRTYRFSAAAAASDNDAYFMVKFDGVGVLQLADASLVDVTDRVSSAPPLRGNLIPNGSFEVGLDRWGIHIRESGGVEHEMPVTLEAIPPVSSAAAARVGRRSLEIRIPGHGRAIVTSTYVKVNAGRRYTLSLWLAASARRQVSVGLAAGRFGARIEHQHTVAVGRQWKRYSLSAVLQPGDEDATYVILQTVGAGTLWVDGVQLEEGAGGGYQPHAPVEVGLLRAGTPTLYRKGAPVDLHLRVADYAAGGEVGLNAYAVDYYGRRRELLRTSRTLQQGEEAEFAIRLPSEVTGYYRVVAEASRDGHVLDRSEMAFGIVYPRTVPPAITSPFGNHARFDDRSLDAAHLLGVSWLRMHPPLGTTWMAVEPTKGSLEFHDRAVDLTRKKGFFILGSLFATPRWASSEPDSRDSWAYPPRSLDEWRDYVYRTVRHYRGVIDYWEVWNEPDSGGFLKLEGPFADYRKPAVYVELLKAAYDAAKRANPDAVIVGGCSSGQPPARWAGEILPRGALQYMDVYSFHRYTNGRPGGVLGLTAADSAAQIRALMKKFGGTVKPIWETESGVVHPASSYDNVIPASPDSFSTPQQQAAYVVRNYVDLLAAGVAKWFYYDMFTSGRVDRNEATGFFEWDGSPRPLAVAYATLAHFIDGLKASKNLKIGEDVQGAEFSGSGRRVDVLWNKAWPEDARTPVRLDPPRAGEVRSVFNIMGGRVAVDGEGISIGRDPVYVVYAPLH